jgi:hypothetical protein
MGGHAKGGAVKKLALNFAGWALFCVAAGFVAGAFLDGAIVTRAVSGILAVLTVRGAYRCWNLAGGHSKPRPPHAPTPERRPWKH